MNCLHEDFDEYFGVCTECNAPRKQVIAENFKNDLQAIYARQLEALGIETGDIAPETAIALERAENVLTDIVSQWLDNRYEEGK